MGIRKSTVFPLSKSNPDKVDLTTQTGQMGRLPYKTNNTVKF